MLCGFEGSDLWLVVLENVGLLVSIGARTQVLAFSFKFELIRGLWIRVTVPRCMIWNWILLQVKQPLLFDSWVILIRKGKGSREWQLLAYVTHDTTEHTNMEFQCSARECQFEAGFASI